MFLSKKRGSSEVMVIHSFFFTFRAVRRAVSAHRSIEGAHENKSPSSYFWRLLIEFRSPDGIPKRVFLRPAPRCPPSSSRSPLPFHAGPSLASAGPPTPSVLFEALVSPPARVRVLSRPPSRAPLPSPPLTTSPLTTWSSPPWRGGFSLPPWQLVGSTMSPQ